MVALMSRTSMRTLASNSSRDREVRFRMQMLGDVSRRRERYGFNAEWLRFVPDGGVRTFSSIAAQSSRPTRTLDEGQRVEFKTPRDGVRRPTRSAI